MAKFLNDVREKLNDAEKFLNSNNPLTPTTNQGFDLPPSYSADGNGLPYSKVPDDRVPKLKRNIISWFVPEFGIVRMYVNPKNITYNYKKQISKERTKGGYTLQYWGEELPNLRITGTTGSSGVEGINALYELYRAEQYAFDSTGLLIASNNAQNSGVQDLLTGGVKSLFSLGLGDSMLSSVMSNVTNGSLGLNALGSLSGNNVTNLAQMAFSVEMYYDGWVFRGYFESMNVTEDSDNFLLSYDINFIVTQRRGYRGNYMPWHRSPKHGPSAWNTPYSYSHKSFKF